LYVTKGETTTPTSISAFSLIHTLTAGSGLIFKDDTNLFDGSSNKELILKTATKTSIGGIMLDNATGSDGSDKSTVSINSDGRLHLTQNNIINALGYKPTAPNEIMEYNIVNTSEAGIVPKLIKTNNTEISAGHYMLAFSGSDTEPSWYKLSSASLNNTWRPIKVNGNSFLDDSNTTELNLIKGDNIELVANNGSIQINAVDTTYEKVTNTADGLMSKEDFIKLSGIEEGAQKNVPAFYKITTSSTHAEATTTQDVVSFTGENISVVANNKNVTFKVNMLKGATASEDGEYGLVPKPLITNRGSFLRGDGTWSIPEQRPIKVGNTTLTTNGELIIEGKNDIKTELSGNTLTITSTYDPHIYEFSTGLGTNTSNNKTTVYLKPATSTEIGGIKISNKISGSITQSLQNSSVTDRYYGVQIDNNGLAFVNVPWTDINNTWRPVSVNGSSINDNSLNIVPVENSSIVIVSTTDTENKESTLGFDLLWFNLDTNEYEK
jgi:hypothetical protein